MATGAKIGTKTRFLREDPVDSGTFVTVAEVKSVGGPSLSRDAVEATTLESPDDPTKLTTATVTATTAIGAPTSSSSSTRTPGSSSRSRWARNCSPRPRRAWIRAVSS